MTLPVPYTHQTSEPLVESRTNQSPALRTITVTVTGEVETPGPLKLIEGTTLKGLFEAARPRPTAYLAHADYGYALREGDEIHIPAVIQKTDGRIVLSDETLLRIRIRSSTTATDADDENTKPLININRADAETLQTLPRIGPGTAEKIIEYRETRGPFKKKDDLRRVRGIGQKTYKWLEALITVE